MPEKVSLIDIAAHTAWYEVHVMVCSLLEGQVGMQVNWEQGVPVAFNLLPGVSACQMYVALSMGWTGHCAGSKQDKPQDHRAVTAAR
jgi:hypothetical protein